MTYYISVLVPLASGRWHAFFPDFPACEAERFARRDLGRAGATRPARHQIG
jgi:hypothetical protein